MDNELYFSRFAALTCCRNPCICKQIANFDKNSSGSFTKRDQFESIWTLPSGKNRTQIQMYNRYNPSGSVPVPIGSQDCAKKSKSGLDVKSSTSLVIRRFGVQPNRFRLQIWQAHPIATIPTDTFDIVIAFHILDRIQKGQGR